MPDSKTVPPPPPKAPPLSAEQLAARAAQRAAMLASLPQAEPLYSESIAAHRAAIDAHRSSAFIRYVPTVAGVRLRPLSLRTRERVVAFEVDLARGSFEDLADFVWLHHSGFGQFAWLRRRIVVAGLRWRLTPRYPHFAGFCLFAGKLFTACGGVRAQLLGRPFHALAWLLTLGRPPTSEARLAAAMAEVRALWRRAHADWPAGDDSGSAPRPVCSMAATVLNAIKGRHPGLTADEILDWPLVELVQWWRALIAEKDPRSPLLDAEEVRLLAEALDPEPSDSPAGPTAP
jgi:hypothetical protein